ncbi:hypothetical protein I79_024012 [Cricetulus griseus]|uniref:Uncharacterized protein n=1 Tax=Cricetulus griseus TaxID=10029 RepID=G3IJH7_CRIGR|nr:hypothetical protein I79_024012 [Cricetulus griseus]
MKLNIICYLKLQIKLKNYKVRFNPCYLTKCTHVRMTKFQNTDNWPGQEPMGCGGGNGNFWKTAWQFLTHTIGSAVTSVLIQNGLNT